MNRITTINPSTGKLIQSYETMSSDAIGNLLDRSHEAWLSWKEQSFSNRSSLLIALGDLLITNRKELAHLISDEMGKVIPEALVEIDKCSWACTHYAAHSAELLAKKLVKTDAKESFVSYQPLGVLFAIMPWNFPFWQVFRFIAPNLMAGNVIVLKHAPNVTGCAQRIGELIQEAGFAEHVYMPIICDVVQTEDIIANKWVRGVTLTGSTRAGRSVAELCGRYLKKCVLELGGSDPYVVLEDADVEMAVTTCLKSRMMNVGQSCIAAKRFIVVEGVYERFDGLLREKMQQLTYGNPVEEVDMGPMARKDLRDSLHNQVMKSVELGASCEIGGFIPDQKGYYYPPTLLTHVRPGMPAFDDEIFGPVVSLIKATDRREAMVLANKTEYGLGSAIFTQNTEQGLNLAEYEMEAGNAFVNQMVKSDPRLPFGGIKSSGLGRELGDQGIYEFVNIKSISLA